MTMEGEIAKAVRDERERIQSYIQALININDLRVNDGELLWNIIQDTLPLKYMQVSIVAQIIRQGWKRKKQSVQTENEVVRY